MRTPRNTFARIAPTSAHRALPGLSAYPTKAVAVLGDLSEASAPSASMLSEPMRVASAWRAVWDRPVWVGEFGSYGKGPYASRVISSRAVRDSMEAHGMTWSYWEFAAGFGLYDPSTCTVRAELRDALFR